MRQDERAQLIIAMGVVLAFTLMAIGSNAVYLTYIRKSTSYSSMNTGDLSGNTGVLGAAIEWKLNSAATMQRPYAPAVWDAINRTLTEMRDVLAPHGVSYSLQVLDISRDPDNIHRVNVTVNITTDDGVNRVQSEYVIPLVNAISDRWPATLASFNYRLPVVIRSGPCERENFPVRVHVEFADELARLGATGQFDPDTITVVEHRPDGSFKAILPHTYDGDRFSGDVIWVAEGRMHPGAYRYFYIYFDLVGGGADLSPSGDLVVSDDGWVNNSRMTLELRNGTVIRFEGSGPVGVGYPSWTFRYNGVLMGVNTGWDTWALRYNSSVYAVVEAVKQLGVNVNLTRTWEFYANSTTIRITDRWDGSGNHSSATFRTVELGYAGRASPLNRSRGVDRPNEPDAPTEAYAGDLACAIHHDNAYVYYAYIFPIDRMSNVEWRKHSIGFGAAINESLEFYQDHRESQRIVHHLYFHYDTSGIGREGVNAVLDKTAALADPANMLVFPAHRRA